MSELYTILILNRAWYPRDKKKIATTVAGLTCLWDSRAIDRMIKRRHTKCYERKMRSNKVEYSTAIGLSCTTHDFKVPVCMSDLSSSKTIEHRFHVGNNKGESGICYGMIIGRDLMVQLGLMADFKRQVLQWDGVIVPIEEPSGLLGKLEQISARCARW